MAKKKRRYMKRRYRSCVSPTVKDTHHLCYIRKSWGQGYARAIRRFPYCKIEIPKSTLHKAIHDAVRCIPAPPDDAAKAVYQELVYLARWGMIHENDPIERRLNILIKLFDHEAPHTADGFRKQLNAVQSYKNKPP